MGHLDQWASAPLVRSNLTHHWSTACRAAEVPGTHFHGLRHLATTRAATTGTTIKELMKRMGHSSPRDALIYQHAVADRDQAIGQALSARVEPVQPLQLPTTGRSARRRAWAHQPVTSMDKRSS